MGNMFYDNVIVVDFDGVCAYWEHGFHVWMVSNGYQVKDRREYEIDKKYGLSLDVAKVMSRMFNESAALAKLPPMRDAIKYIRKLHEDHGYVFHCISAIPDDHYVYEARWKNIENLFGKTAFEKLTLCETSRNKSALLAEYKDAGCFWVEDLPKNAEMGLKYGMKPLVMRQPYNDDYKHPLIPHVDNWKEIYEYVVGERLHPV